MKANPVAKKKRGGVENSGLAVASSGCDATKIE